MWEVKLKTEIAKQLNDPETFTKGLANVYAGLFLAMAGVMVMLFLFSQDSKHILKPFWLMLLGFSLVAWGEWQKYKSR